VSTSDQRGTGKLSIAGVIPAVVTPRQPDEELDLQTLGQVVNYLVSADVDGLFVVGGQGESWTLDAAQQAAVIEASVAAAGGRVPVYAGVTASTTRQAVSLAGQATRLGAAAVVSMPPCMTPTTDEELRGYFAAIADASGTPLVLYNHPTRSGRPIPLGVISALSEHPNICAVKDSSGALGFALEVIERTEGLAVLMGHDDLIAAGMLYGCVGAVAATANVTPTLVVDLVRAAAAGDLVRAMELQRALHKVRRLVERYPFPKVVKEGMVLIGLPAGPSPQPVSPLATEVRNELNVVLTELGVTADQAVG